MTQLLAALAHIHQSKVIHLDLKPENLILEADNQTLRLIDFGEAQTLQLAGVGGNMATASFEAGAEFLPPETISAGPVGHYTDMWSFGVILYILLSGLSPFLGDSEEETVNNILLNLLLLFIHSKPLKSTRVIQTLRTLQKFFCILRSQL